jgi:hypothetical protein
VYDRKIFFDRSTLWKHVVQRRCVQPKAFGTVSRQYSGHIFLGGLDRRKLQVFARFSAAEATCGHLFLLRFDEPRRLALGMACTASTATLCAVNVRLRFRDLTCSCPSDSLNISSHRRSPTPARSSRWGSLLTFGHLCLFQPSVSP